jgi:hypothetical protein
VGRCLSVSPSGGIGSIADRLRNGGVAWLKRLDQEEVAKK